MPGIARRDPPDILERQHDRISLPHRVLLPILGGAGAKALLRGEPLAEDRLGAGPAQHVLGRLLVLRIAHDHVGERRRVDELAGRAFRQPGVERVLPQRRTLLGLIRLGLALTLDIDRGAIVARIVPGEPALVAAFLPEGDGVLDRFDGLLAVEHHRLAVGTELLTAEGPQERIPERGGIAEGMARGLPERMPGRLQFLAGGAIVVPGLRELAVAVADLGEPRFAVGEQPGDDRPRYAEPFLAVVAGNLEEIPMAALLLADLLNDVADIDDAVAIKLRPVAQREDHVRPRAGLDR